MNIKKNLIILYTLINIILIFFVSFSNTKKVNINIFTWKSNNHSLGKIISFSFMTGISFNTLLSLIILSYESNNNSSKENDFQDRNEREDDLLFEDNPERPPERDIKETQPTISVFFGKCFKRRFIDS